MIAPLALIGLVALPIIVAFYMLRLRRRDMPVGSTFLWQQLVRDVEANAPWQRLRFSWLLLVQLLIALLVVLAASRPFVTVSSDLAANVVLIVDTSASMGATDPEGPRMDAAREAARRVIGELPEGGRVTVVAAGDSAHVLVSETDDRAAALAAVEGIGATQVPGDLTDAFALASALAARDADSTVVVVTDANADRLPRVGIGAPIVVERVGSTDANQAVAALSAVRRSGGAQVDLFVAVSNPSATEASRRLEVYADGQLVDARDLTIPAEQRTEALISSVPAGAALVEARLVGSDALAVDDRAFALVPSEAVTRTLLVSEGNTYLENALALLPRLELYAVGPGGYEDALAEADEAGTPYGLVVFDRFVPDEAPPVPTLWVGPDEDGPFGTVEGRVNGPALAPHDPNDPLLRFLDLSTLHVGRAAEVELADGMRPVLSASGGEPLIAAGRVAGRTVALLTFALGESDLPLQVAFPLLVSNLTDFLLPPTGGPLPPSVQLGEPLVLDLDPSITRVGVQAIRADAPSEAERLELEVVGGRVTIPGARTPGFLNVTALEGVPEGRDPLIGVTAANLFDPGESRVAPGDPLRIADLGRPSSGGGEALPARSEWWWPLALAALLLLLVEWLLFHRPSRRTAARLLGRGGRAAVPSVSGPARGPLR
ncbi:MAG TPA: BatA and WFA domain-containing protein [candidate division Zixibacteria bacterium]|nr:BatA and WFA domain-containing protein [candidate division Zixibacteria bacterium]